MTNLNIDQFMNQFPGEALTFDDVSLVTQYADFLPADTDIHAKLSRNLTLNVPFISAAMDTVTESEMAIAMAMNGGIGIIHKNLSVREQAREVEKVKKYLHGRIEKPVTFSPEITVQELLAFREQRKLNFSGFPIVDENNKLCGIITARDIRFCPDLSLKVKEVMTKNPITASPQTTLEEAYQIMIRYKIGKLPLVDDKGTLVGLYSFHDVNSIIGQEKQQHAVVSRDQNYRLLVGAAIGPYEFDRVEALAQAGVDVIVIDTAHGHSKGVIETVRELKQHHSLKCDIIAGNIATREGAQDLLKAGVDAVKVGIGPGSICTTRVVCGVGIPQLSAIYEVSKGINNEVPIIADGGIKYSGDVPKAIAVGADTVMMGSVFAGTRESPGEKIMRGGQMYVMYRGMGSLEALKRGKGSRERYGHHETSDSSDIIPQGIEAMVELRGSVRDIIRQFAGGLRFSLGYCGARNLAELKAKAKFVRVTNAGVREAHPHDVIIYRDAPNYSVHSSRE